ncbi:MAG: Hsp20/alpha crystallin family protein [Thermoleophilia bacterium]|nr:Hsp20/alpha crystallin family protein [Thermoleophilia bacterium]
MDAKRKSQRPGHGGLQGEVDRMFLEMLRGDRVPRCGRAAFRPSADVYFDDGQKAVVVKLELPGIDADAVSLVIEENVLRVSGIRSDERPADAVYHQMEIVYGPFERSVMLPPGLDATQASADYHHGYLEIRLPLKPPSVSRKIPIAGQEQGEGSGK